MEEYAKDEGAKLFDANREGLVQQTCDDIDSCITDLEKQIINTGTGNDLTSVNILMRKQQAIQTQTTLKTRQVEEIDKQTEYLQNTVPGEKMPAANSADYGNSLFDVNVLGKKNQSLSTGIDNHEPRIMTICTNGRKLIDEGHEDADGFEGLIKQLFVCKLQLQGTKKNHHRTQHKQSKLE